ncbi:hypothetical protein ACN47E_003174 [Coniothyrium glycines]
MTHQAAPRPRRSVRLQPTIETTTTTPPRAKPAAQPYRLAFGKHKGSTLRECPHDYVNWLLNERKRFQRSVYAPLQVALDRYLSEDSASSTPARLIPQYGAVHSVERGPSLRNGPPSPSPSPSPGPSRPAPVRSVHSPLSLSSASPHELAGDAAIPPSASPHPPIPPIPPRTPPPILPHTPPPSRSWLTTLWNTPLSVTPSGKGKAHARTPAPPPALQNPPSSKTTSWSSASPDDAAMPPSAPSHAPMPPRTSPVLPPPHTPPPNRSWLSTFWNTPISATPLSKSRAQARTSEPLPTLPTPPSINPTSFIAGGTALADPSSITPSLELPALQPAALPPSSPSSSPSPSPSPSPLKRPPSPLPRKRPPRTLASKRPGNFKHPPAKRRNTALVHTCSGQGDVIVQHQGSYGPRVGQQFAEQVALKVDSRLKTAMREMGDFIEKANQNTARYLKSDRRSSDKVRDGESTKEKQRQTDAIDQVRRDLNDVDKRHTDRHQQSMDVLKSIRDSLKKVEHVRAEYNQLRADTAARHQGHIQEAQQPLHHRIRQLDAELERQKRAAQLLNITSGIEKSTASLQRQHHAQVARRELDEFRQLADIQATAIQGLDTLRGGAEAQQPLQHRVRQLDAELERQKRATQLRDVKSGIEQSTASLQRQQHAKVACRELDEFRQLADIQATAIHDINTQREHRAVMPRVIVDPMITQVFETHNLPPMNRNGNSRQRGTGDRRPHVEVTEEFDAGSDERATWIMETMKTSLAGHQQAHIKNWSVATTAVHDLKTNPSGTDRVPDQLQSIASTSMGAILGVKFGNIGTHEDEESDDTLSHTRTQTILSSMKSNTNTDAEHSRFGEDVLAEHDDGTRELPGVNRYRAFMPGSWAEESLC